jgi:hypothetical protein
VNGQDDTLLLVHLPDGTVDTVQGCRFFRGQKLDVVARSGEENFACFFGELVRSKKFIVYPRKSDRAFPQLTIYLSEENLEKLMALKRGTGMTIKSLLNTSVRNIM